MENIEDEKDHLISLYTNLGLEFKVFKKYSLAISNLEKAKYISQEINNTEAIFDTILNLVEVFMDQEKYVIAKSKLQEAIQIANEERDLYLFADYYTAEAKLSYKKKEIEETNIFLDKALAEDPYQADALGLKTEIQIDKKIKDYNKKVKERENEFSEQITNERVKLIEYLSVFTAIIALIFVSINIVIQFTVMDALIILAGMSIFISNFIFLLKFFLKDEYKNFLFCLLFMIAMIFILMTLKLFGEPW